MGLPSPPGCGYNMGTPPGRGRTPRRGLRPHSGGRRVGRRLVTPARDLPGGRGATTPGGAMADAELRTRRHFIESVRSRGEAPDQTIGDSWDRCRPVLDAHVTAAPVDAEPDEVRQRWEASPIRRSGVGLEDQLERAAAAGDLVAAVTDADGRILWSVGSRAMRRRAEQVGFVPGGRWDEPSAGTNALGLALLS